MFNIYFYMCINILLKTIKYFFANIYHIFSIKFPIARSNTKLISSQQRVMLSRKSTLNRHLKSSPPDDKSDAKLFSINSIHCCKTATVLYLWSVWSIAFIIRYDLKWNAWQLQDRMPLGRNSVSVKSAYILPCILHI